ncbi:TonB-dependent receptor [Termitidicoccus mucosus]|uniref:TonB-dependent receptor n=1 Tax=Termitidicoccus mucosus TaxID=1184151 RepID=A0A178ILJ5_9BACT|nr:hypothetical protein AW736_06135 [Opitutaceae bacterium TSB47]
MKLAKLPILLLTALLALPSAHAQTVRTGSVTGRVYNPSTEEYVSNARIRVAQTGETAVSEMGGFYHISNLTPGEVTLELSYAGYSNVAATVAVAAGATTTKDFELPASRDDDVVQLERFTVSAEREGQAKAIMDQRASMNLTQVVSSDVFGNDPEGNIGEFLRNVPGVFINTELGEVTSVSFGGLSAEYVNVTVDGLALATADAETTNRATSFSAISLSSMDSLEVSRTISADVDANAPAGTVNMRSKSAFTRRGTNLMAQATLTMASGAGATFQKTYGPDDNGGVFKIRPGFIVEFSHAVRNKYGIIINVSDSDIYSEQHRLIYNVDYNPTPADPRPYVPTSMALLQSPRTNRRFATTIRGDWRVTPRLAVGLGLIYNYSRLWNLRRTVTFDTGYTRANPGSVLGGDDILSRFETTGASRVTANFRTISRMTQTVTLTPRFEYRIGDFSIEGLVSHSDSMSWLASMGRTGGIYNLNTLTTSNVRYRVERLSNRADATDFKFTQTSGPDIASGTVFSKPSLFPDDGRDSTQSFLTTQINASLLTRWLFPIQWKAGLKRRDEKRTFDQDYYTGRATWNGGANWGNFKSAYRFDMGGHNMQFETLSGGTLFMANLQAIGAYYREHPEEFVTYAPDSTTYASDYYNAKVRDHRDFSECIDAAYLMATGMLLDKRLHVRAGLRHEKTMTDVLEPDPRTEAELAAAGHPFDPTTGRATYLDGINYQFFSRPWRHRKNAYDNFFPSASLKYDITTNLDIKLGMSTTIRRPTYSDLTGVTTVNHAEGVVSLPNIYLQVENGRSYGAQLNYYFKGVGNLSVGAYQNDLKNKIEQSSVWGDELPGELADMAEQYPGYEFNIRRNRPGETRMRSLEVGWRQHLGFIAPALKRLVLRANYTRAYANYISTRVVPHAVNAGLTFTYRKFNIYTNYNWTDEFPISDTGITYSRHRTQVDLGGGYKFNRTYSLSFHIRNLFDEPYTYMRNFPQFPDAGSPLYQSVRGGTSFRVSIRGEW